MIERAIENWLTNTNERNYQTPFCQALMVRGHAVLYKSRHRPMEQGKDIITTDGSGQFHAYQLKTGDINLMTWRNIQGEIGELVELPIVHPSVPTGADHRSYLVCNGEITDEVRIQISQINEDNERKQRQYSYLDVITFPKLLGIFVDAQREFLPNSIEDFDAFRRIQLSDGRDFIDKAALAQFLTGSVLISSAKRNSDRIHAISSSVVLLGHLLKPYQEKENHFALFEAWGLLAALIVKYSSSQNLKKRWQESFNLAFEEAISNLHRLKEETLGRTNFLEGEPMGDGGDMYRGRLTTVLGALAVLELHLLSEGTSDKPDNKVVDLTVSNLNKLWLWGDSAVPFLLNIAWLLEKAGNSVKAEEILKILFTSILQSNAGEHGKAIPLPSPYYSLSQVLETVYGLADDAIDVGSFAGDSYSLEVVIQVISRRELRHLVEPNWRKATHIHVQAFVPERTEDYFSWHTTEGKNTSYFLTETQSWRSLVEESRQRSDGFLLRNQKILRLFTLIAPHRMTKETAVIVDPYMT